MALYKCIYLLKIILVEQYLSIKSGFEFSVLTDSTEFHVLTTLLVK